LETRALFAAIGGLPFIHDSFKPMQLFKLAVLLRNKIASTHPNAESYIGADLSQPEVALGLYASILPNAAPPQPSVEPPTSLVDAVESAKARITDRWQEWNKLLALPTILRRLTTDAVSSTNPFLPQHLYLGDPALSNDDRLEETLVHEYSHLWCQMIAEIRDFQTTDSPADFVLPSGTGGRTPRGVVFAALFAAAAVNFYGRWPEKAARRSYLLSYLEGCLALERLRDFMLPAGDWILTSLSAFSNEQSSTQVT